MKYNTTRLEALISENVPENRELEFKELIIVNNDGEKKEFLYDVSSFANANGGSIIYGIKELNGTAQSIVSINENIDKLICKLENLLRDNVEPRIIGMLIYEVKSLKNGSVIVIEVPKSWQGPHQVTYQRTNKFYSRNSAGKYLLNVYELKNEFLKYEGIQQKITNWNIDRINAIESKNSFLEFQDHGKVLVNIVPLNAFDGYSNQSYNLSLIYNRSFSPLSAGAIDAVINFEGVLFSCQLENDKYYSYLQVYKNGIIETATDYLLRPYDQKLEIPFFAATSSGMHFEQDIIRCMEEILKIHESIGLIQPYFVLISLIGLKDYGIGLPGKVNFQKSFVTIKANTLQLQPIFVENRDIEVEKILKPVFDQIWNIFGYTGSNNYDKNGSWMPPLW